MKTKRLFMSLIALLSTLGAYAQSPDSTNITHDSLKVIGDAHVGGFLITKHIKSPDGTVHIGDSSMTFSSYASISNPIKGSSYAMEAQSTSGSTSSIGIGWGTNTAAASRAFALGYNTKAYGDNSMAFGNLAEADADQGTAFGYSTKVSSSATYAIALGSGLTLTPMTNNTSQSLAVGFNSTVPTFFVTGGNGTSGSLGNVGIGTTTLNARLSVYGDAIFAGTTGTPTVSAYIKGNSDNSTASTPDYTWYSDLTTGMFHPASSVIAFSKAGTEVMRVHSNGNVGIGTTSPSYTLDVSGNARITGALTAGAATVSSLTNSGAMSGGATTVTSFTNTGSTILSGSIKNTTYTVGTSGKRVLLVDETGLFSALAYGTSSQVLYGNGAWGSLPAQTFTLSGSNAYFTGGKVGIGTSTPSYSLDVSGDIRATGTITGGATSVTSFTNSGNTTLSGSLSSGATTVTSFTSTGAIHGGATTVSSLTSGGDLIGNAATVSSLTASGGISAATLTVTGNQTISGSLTTNTITASVAMTTPKLTTARIMPSDTNGVHFGDSSTVINTVPVAVTNPISGQTLTYDMVYSSLNRLSVGKYQQALGQGSMAIGTNTVAPSKAYGVNSMAIGTGGAEADAQASMAIGSAVKTGNGATGCMVMGRGVSGSALTNTVTNTFMMGFNSDVPTFYVGASSGAGTTGKVGIGTTSPDSKLAVYGSSDEGGITSKTTHTTDDGYNTYIDVNRSGTKALAVVNEGTGGGSPTESFLVWGDGHTKIGVSSITAGAHTDAMLTVAGKTVSKSFYVTTQNWSDFVFDNNYKLMKLEELEAFYKKNHHLPNVPTEKEIKQNGNNLGETDALLLQKIEELTLYLVQQQKDIEALKKQNAELEQKLNQK